MQVGFPQKSSFGVITATEVRTPVVNNPDGNLLFKRAGTTVLECRSTLVLCRGDVRLGTDFELQDNIGGALIAGDNAGNVDQLGGLLDAIRICASAAQAYTGLTTGTATVKNDGGLEVSADGIVYFGLSLPNRLVTTQLEISAIVISYSTAHNDSYITATYGIVYPIPMAAGVDVISDPTDRGNGSTGNESYSAPIIGNANLDDYPALNLSIECECTAGLVTIYSIDILLKMKD